MKEERTELTRGSVSKTISLFALPMLLGNILQQLYNIVDTWIVGRYICSDALASVGSVFALMVFLAKIASYTAIGVLGIWWAIPIGWILADITGLIYYTKRRNQLYE